LAYYFPELAEERGYEKNSPPTPFEVSCGYTKKAIQDLSERKMGVVFGRSKKYTLRPTKIKKKSPQNCGHSK
jgi:hypothetical protein